MVKTVVPSKGFALAQAFIARKSQNAYEVAMITDGQLKLTTAPDFLRVNGFPVLANGSKSIVPAPVYATPAPAGA